MENKLKFRWFRVAMVGPYSLSKSQARGFDVLLKEGISLRLQWFAFFSCWVEIDSTALLARWPVVAVLCLWTCMADLWLWISRKPGILAEERMDRHLDGVGNGKKGRCMKKGSSLQGHKCGHFERKA